VLPGNQSAHEADWNVVRENTAWVASNATSQQPFFLYQGLNIVHPDYDTSEVYINRIDQSKIKVIACLLASPAGLCCCTTLAFGPAQHPTFVLMRSARLPLITELKMSLRTDLDHVLCAARLQVPFWPPLDTLHPCDYQTTLKKGFGYLPPPPPFPPSTSTLLLLLQHHFVEHGSMCDDAARLLLCRDTYLYIPTPSGIL
jgi:hypothetical protein